MKLARLDPLRWLIRHPFIHRVVHRLTARGEPYENADGSLQYPVCVIDRYVWGRLMAEPGFAEGLERGRADLVAGRFTRYSVDELRDLQ